MAVFPTHGNFRLSSVGNLPRVTVAFPGEKWSDCKASGVVEPGDAVVPVGGAGQRHVRKAVAADVGAQLAIALRPIDIPDTNTGPDSKGPNEVRNQAIQHGEYVLRYYSGAFLLTVVRPDTYNVGDLIGWDADGARPTGMSGTGSWAKNAVADIDSVFEVLEWRPVNDAGTEGILTVRSLRGQF